MDPELKKEIFDSCELILDNLCEIHQNIKVITENEGSMFNSVDDTDVLIQIDYINDCVQEVENNIHLITKKALDINSIEFKHITSSMKDYFDERLFFLLEEEVDKMIEYLKKN